MSAIRGFFVLVIALVVFQAAFMGTGIVVGGISGLLAIDPDVSRSVGLGLSLVVAAIAAGRVVS